MHAKLAMRLSIDGRRSIVQPVEDVPERRLNIQMDAEHVAGVYANFANISFSDYEFTVTFARIDHEVEGAEVQGIVVSRVNMSMQFMKELTDAINDSWSKYATVKGIQDLPEAPPRGDDGDGDDED
jgi:hypothetical protein